MKEPVYSFDFGPKFVPKFQKLDSLSIGILNYFIIFDS